MDRRTPYNYCLKKLEKNGESYTAAVQQFKDDYKLSKHNCVPTRKSVILWVNNFRAAGSAISGHMIVFA